MITFFILIITLILFSYFTVILATNPIYSLLSLMSVIFGMSITLFYLEFEFLPYMMLIIYIGAVLVLFLFVLMMININFFYKRKNKIINYLYFIFFIKLVFLFQYVSHALNLIFYNSITTHSTLWVSNLISYKTNDILLFANLLYTHFFVHTLLIALILLLVMIGSISLCLTKKLTYDS